MLTPLRGDSLRGHRQHHSISQRLLLTDLKKPRSCWTQELARSSAQENARQKKEILC